MIATRTKTPDNKLSTSTPSISRKRGRKPILGIIIEQNPEAYHRYLNYLRLGCYLHTAAAAIGVSRHTVYHWMVRGRKHQDKEQDSIYRQFFTDVMRAIAQARLQKELQLSQLANESFPALKFWLQCGPGRLLGDQWREEWKPDLNLASQAKEAELEPRCPINTDTMAGALEVLE